MTRSTTYQRPRFNDAFRRRDPVALVAVVHDDCLMVSAQPAADGTAYAGKDACVAFEVDHVFSDGPWAAVRWRYRFGPTDAESVLGVDLTRVSAGRVTEQWGTRRRRARCCRCRSEGRQWQPPARSRAT